MVRVQGQSRDPNVSPRVGAAPGSAHPTIHGPTARMGPFVPLTFSLSHLSFIMFSSPLHFLHSFLLSFSLPSYHIFFHSFFLYILLYPSFLNIFYHARPPFLLFPITTISSLFFNPPAFLYHSLPFLTYFIVLYLVSFIRMSLLPSCLSFCLSFLHSYLFSVSHFSLYLLIFFILDLSFITLFSIVLFSSYFSTHLMQSEIHPI